MADNRTLLGRTLGKIRDECGVDSISMMTPKDVKDKLKYVAVPQAESWRIDILKELLDVRSNKSDISDFSRNQISTMTSDICTS